MSSEGALALALAMAAPGNGLLYVGGDAGLVARLATMARGFAPDLSVIELPPWDNLPYDRSRPSRAVTGTRVAELAALARGMSGRFLVLTTPEALLQRVPPRDRLREREVRLAVGDELDPEWFRDTLTGFGYRFEEVVDEPGEAAIRGAVIDVFPADSTVPLRLDLADGRIASIATFDNLTQRSTAARDSLHLMPASEAFTVPGEALPERLRRMLPDGPLETLSDYLPAARLLLAPEARDRMDDWLELVRDSFAMRQVDTNGAEPVSPPEHLYLRADELLALLDAHQPPASWPEQVAAAEPLPPLASVAAAAAAVRQYSADAAVVLCHPDIDRWHTALQRRLGGAPERLPDWHATERLSPGDVALLRLPLSEGFRLPGRVVLALQTEQRRDSGEDQLAWLTQELRIGDLAVEPEHGLGRLTGLTPLGEPQPQTECLVLGFARDSRLLVPALEAGRLWRYGAEAALSPDRLEGGSWVARRQQVEADIDAAAQEILRRARERQATNAPALPRGRNYDRFARRVPFPLTGDQRRAIAAVLDDMAAGHPMHRLVCGDVGFGKTEIALHAAAVAALAGYQVAVAAPTTLLASQHLETFRRRLQGFGLRIEPLIRSSRSAAAQATLRGLADGSVHIVVGTQAVAARSVRFARLGLVVIDEEQRFGEAQKRALRTQGGRHTLVMTATPLPRSLQSALAGLMEVSLLTQPPAAREPVRTFAAPFDAAVVRAALLREVRRGGQSFVVCPRIEDIAPMQARLAELAPELSVIALHGRMRGEALDRAMLDFAAGRHDVLLATSIIEAGLDLPNANTMLVWRADRFGLAQLHQLRGRVGRGRTRAVAYLLTDPGRGLSAPARKRLDKLVALEQRGAGFAISAADLDLRGAGDLLGDRQSGHLRLLGTDLYRHLMERALRRARGEAMAEGWTPELALELPAYVPADFIPEPDLRLEVYRRLAGLRDLHELSEAAEELADRFGDLPPPFAALLEVTRLRLLCCMHGIAAVQAGPRGIALTARHEGLSIQGARRSGDRLLLPIGEPDPVRRLERLNGTLAEAEFTKAA